MAFFNSFGTQMGAISHHFGRQIFVAPSATYTLGARNYVASDANAGLSPENALLTVAAAQTLATAGAGDVIVLLPGAHTVTASIAASKSGVTYTGLPRAGATARRQSGFETSITISASDQIMNVTAADIEICHLRIIPITAQVGIDFSAAANRLHVHDCYFDMETPAVNTGTKGLVALGAAQGAYVENCQFVTDGAQGVALDATATINMVVERCRFLNTAGTWAAAVLTGAATSGFFMQWCEWHSFGTAITAGVDGTGATIARGCAFNYCTFGNLVTVGIDNYDLAEAEINECYKMGVGATDGGTKLTAIT